MSRPKSALLKNLAAPDKEAYLKIALSQNLKKKFQNGHNGSCKDYLTNYKEPKYEHVMTYQKLQPCPLRSTIFKLKAIDSIKGGKPPAFSESDAIKNQSLRNYLNNNKHVLNQKEMEIEQRLDYLTAIQNKVQHRHTGSAPIGGSLKDKFLFYSKEKELKGAHIKSDAMKLLAKHLLKARKSPLRLLQQKAQKQKANYSREDNKTSRASTRTRTMAHNTIQTGDAQTSRSQKTLVFSANQGFHSRVPTNLDLRPHTTFTKERHLERQLLSPYGSQPRLQKGGQSIETMTDRNQMTLQYNQKNSQKEIISIVKRCQTATKSLKRSQRDLSRKSRQVNTKFNTFRSRVTFNQNLNEQPPLPLDILMIKQERNDAKSVENLIDTEKKIQRRKEKSHQLIERLKPSQVNASLEGKSLIDIYNDFELSYLNHRKKVRTTSTEKVGIIKKLKVDNLQKERSKRASD